MCCASFLVFLSLSWGGTVDLLNQELCQELQTIPEYSNYQISANVILKNYQEKYFPNDAEIKVILPEKRDIGQITYAKVLVFEKGKLFQTLRLKFLVEILADVYCAKTALEKGTALGPEQFYFCQKNVLRYKQLADRSFVFQGKQLLSDLKADDPLYTWMAKRPPTVLVGDIITVTIYSRDVQLAMEAKVLQQGYPGDRILVQLTSTKKVFRALIVESGKFEIRL